MGQRLDLHNLLKEVLGSEYVYFQPPADVQMVYPCIVYQRDTIRTEFADDRPYKHDRRYQVTVIHSNPDNPIVQKLAELPKSVHVRFFTADKLNHDVFNIFF